MNLGVGTVFTTTVSRPAVSTKAVEEDPGDTVGSSNDDSSNPEIFPVIQLTPIGMRLGGEKVAFTAELGVGYKGFCQVGLNIAL